MVRVHLFRLGKNPVSKGWKQLLLVGQDIITITINYKPFILLKRFCAELDIIYITDYLYLSVGLRTCTEKNKTRYCKINIVPKKKKIKLN